VFSACDLSRHSRFLPSSISTAGLPRPASVR